MDAKKARETLMRLCAEWDRAGQLMNRYIRPAGFSLALGVGIATSAGCSSSGSSDALPPAQDSAREALPAMIDAYGVLDGVAVPLDSAREALPPPQDAYGLVVDVPIRRDGGVDLPDSARDALPPAQDVYGLSIVDARLDLPDGARDVLPPAQDGDGYHPTVDSLASRPGGGDAGANAAGATPAQDGADGGAGN